MEVKPWFRELENLPLSPEYGCPLNRGNRYKYYVGVFPGTNSVSPEWKCSMSRGVDLVSQRPGEGVAPLDDLY